MVPMAPGALLLLLLATGTATAWAQDGTLRVQVRSQGSAVEGATVVVSGVERTTNDRGEAVVPVPAGSTTLTVARDGFAPVSTDVAVTAGAEQVVVVDLVAQPAIEEDVTVIGAMRNERRVDDIAMRVDVLPREEIEEKMMMTPGDIVMMLNEMGGMRVQATSPSLGAASVRVQGMRGRHTRVLSDGLPLFGDVAGLGLLQIPPMDLGQVEVIKGVASALYGAGAMGGVINLVSRRPTRKPERELLVNRSALGATDATAFLSSPLAGRWSGTLLTGGHWQSKNDVDDDGWADLAGYERAVVRPRVFWDNGAGSTFFATAGFTGESRTGGTVAALPATGLPYVESLATRRDDAGAVAQFLVADRYVITARSAFNRQRHTHAFGERLERDRHATAFTELAARGAAGRHGWVGGVAFQRDTYRARDVSTADYSYNVPGVFGQYDADLTPALTVSGSARFDVHSEYGMFLSPRLSLLVRRGEWTGRLSIGSGFFGPTPITEDTEAAGLTTLIIDRPLKAERGTSASFDLTRRQGVLTYTATLFASRIADPIRVDRAPIYRLRNLSDPTLNLGVELLTTIRSAPYALTGTYTYVHATESDNGVTSDVTLTPRHSIGVVGMWEREDVGRAGLELYVTGSQRLEENPYRARSAAYVIIGALAERRVGPIRIFVNGENLGGVRQTNYDALVRPTRGVDGRWAVDAWTSLEGRNVNGGVRVSF